MAMAEPRQSVEPPMSLPSLNSESFDLFIESLENPTTEPVVAGTLSTVPPKVGTCKPRQMGLLVAVRTVVALCQN